MEQQNVAGDGQLGEQGEGQADGAEGMDNPGEGVVEGGQDEGGGGEEVAQEGGGVNKPVLSRPYCFRKCREPPTTLYMLSMRVVLRRYLHTEVNFKELFHKHNF